MFLKSKKFWIIAGIVLFIVIMISIFSSQPKALEHEVVKVERGDLLQTVDVTGKIKSENDVSLQFETGGVIDKIYVAEGEEVKKGDLIQTVDVTGKIKSENNLSLYFESSGIIDKIYVAEGEEVKRGDVLAKLNLDNLNSLVKQAEANLIQKQAGVSEEQINVSLKQISASEVAYKKAESNLENVKNLAQENLKNKYASALDLLDDLYIKLFNVLKFSEDLRDTYFLGLSQEDIAVKNEIKYKIKDPVNEAKNSLNIAKSTKSISDTDNALSKMDSSVKSTIDALLFIKNISENVVYKNVISSSFKSALDQNKSTISNSQISLTSFQNDVSLLKLQNENNINAAKLSAEEALANLELQKANHNSLIAPPRDVDLAYLRSVLNQAIANRDKAIITSPINGIVTKINKEERELISMSEPLFEILSPKYQIEVNIPETDVTKISLGDKADIELGAIESSALKAEIASINPAATLIQDVVYYKVILTILEKDDRIKPGMTANILIYVDERSDVLYLPSRSILSEKDRKYVRVLQNGKIVEKDIEVGLNADDSKREILRGVNEDDEIVLKVLK